MTKLAFAYRTAGFMALVGLALYISYVSALRYLTGAEAAPPPIVANAFASPFLVLHVSGGIVALLVGPVQFIDAVRRRWVRIHRATGVAYVAACSVGAPAGLVLALGTTSGPVAGAGFATLAVMTLYFTGRGLSAAVARRFAEHREWMMRSYALIAAAITLRLMIPAALMLGLEFGAAYPAIAWLCWIANLALIEFHIRRKRGAAPAFERLAPA